MLSICFVSHEYPEETGSGGIGTYTFEMAHGLARAGHKVTVISRALRDAQHYVETDGVEVFRIRPLLNANSTPLLSRLNQWSEGYGLAVALKIKQILRKRPLDVIESPEFQAEPLLYSMLFSRPRLVVRLQTGRKVLSNYDPYPGHKRHRAERWLLRRAVRIISPSEALRDAEIEPGQRNRCSVIPNPVDIDHFKPNGTFSHSDQCPNVLYVGRPRSLKGIHVLAQSIPAIWREIPKAIFTFAAAPMRNGDPWPRDTYRDFLDDLMEDSRIRILGHVRRANLPDLYRAATVCVVPSLWDGFPYAATEAMACGVPVIASRVGGLPEIVEDGRSGLLFESGNAAQLADAVVRVLRDPERGAQMGEAARQRAVNRFSTSKIAPQVVEVYEQVIQS